jgi:hypothetical protein
MIIAIENDKLTWYIALSVAFLFTACTGNSSDHGHTLELIGSDLSEWRTETGEWQVAGAVSMDPDSNKLLISEPGTGIILNGPAGKTVDLLSRQEFGDVAVHVEFMIPRESNSGVYFMARYEVQVFDSYGEDEVTYTDCGGIYQRWDENRDPKGFEGHAPGSNASRPPGEWQSFDVIFRAPEFDADGNKITSALFEKVVHNGVTIHENVTVYGPTRASTYDDEVATGPLMLQGDHGPVAYRNITITPL